MAKKHSKEEIKCILVGETGTGKTSLINVSIGLQFEKDIVTTISSTYASKQYQISEKTYILNLWDTTGQEKYRTLTKIFIKNSKIVIFVYDITNKKSFDELEYWMKVIDEILGKEPIIGICGNKNDLFNYAKIKEEKAAEFAKSKGAFFQTTSAKEDPLGFNNFLEILLKAYLNKKNINSNDENNGVKLSYKYFTEKVKECC